MISSSTNDVRLFEISPGVKFSQGVLRRLLPDVETLLFFAKVYALGYTKVGELLQLVFPNVSVIEELTAGNHSTELQDYVLDLATYIPEYVQPGTAPEFVAAPPPATVLPELWKASEVEVAQSIKDVAAKLEGVLSVMSRQQEGRMVFQHMAKLNAKRPGRFGVYGPQIVHPYQVDNLVILDVSGSMTSRTVQMIVDDVVALSYKANAHLAIVSNDTFHWAPGQYDVRTVLASAQYGGTHYDTLVDLFKGKSWGTVVTIADYDSYSDAREVFKRFATGTVEKVLDISLVNRPTFLSECVGVIAKEVSPLMVAPTSYVLQD